MSIITTGDADGRVNAASFATCTRVSHEPVSLAFAVNVGKDTYANVLATGEFVVNIPAFDRRQLEQVRIAGLNFAPGRNELEPAGLTAIPSTRVRPPRIADFGRHFECTVDWTKEWRGHLLVIGLVVAASHAPRLADERGFIDWDRARPVHFCGWPYRDAFVPMFEILRVDMAYGGPKASAGERTGGDRTEKPADFPPEA